MAKPFRLTNRSSVQTLTALKMVRLHGILPDDTQRYVDKVLARAEREQREAIQRATR